MNTINAHDVEDRLAEQIKPGHVTVDGVVLKVTESGLDTVKIEHRNVDYWQKRGDVVQIIGRLDHAGTQAVVEHARREGWIE